MSQMTGILDPERESSALNIIRNKRLTFMQQILELYKLGEDTVGPVTVTEELRQAMDEGVLCDLWEGNAPFRPRYVIPDYSILFKKGCEFLELGVPEDLQEACNSLLIMYRHIPSSGGYPVYLGQIDELLEPYVLKEDRARAKRTLQLFLKHIDKAIPDSFVHVDIGPYDTLTARLILECTEEMQLAVPNISLKYDPEKTSDEFAALCAKCMLKTAKPSFANDVMIAKEWGSDYGIASCLNLLKIAGGGYTLARIKLHDAAKKAKDVQDFKENILPYYMRLLLEFIDRRITFMSEESVFFQTNFLVKEGFIDQEKFTGMVGVVGLAECVNHLLNIHDPKQGFGNNEAADDLGVEICEIMDQIVKNHPGVHCSKVGGIYGMHAQVGISDDGRSNTPGTRIPIGAEPELSRHLAHSARFHKYFPTGAGDIFTFENTWQKTPEALVDIIKGSFAMGVRYFSGYTADSDVVRVTGYLVKKSELAKLDRGEQVLNGATVLGKGQRDGSQALNRRIEEVK